MEHGGVLAVAATVTLRPLERAFYILKTLRLQAKLIITGTAVRPLINLQME